MSTPETYLIVFTFQFLCVPSDSPYTILIPSDNAFQRWHPIDWGFYPFSVSEFTENVLRNHVLQLKTPVRLEDVRMMHRGEKYKTLGGEVVVFKNSRKWKTRICANKELFNKLWNVLYSSCAIG